MATVIIAVMIKITIQNAAVTVLSVFIIIMLIGKRGSAPGNDARVNQLAISLTSPPP